MSQSSEWETSKENIQPIQQGRKQAVLQTALQTDCERLNRDQRRALENKLRDSKGEELLIAWTEYIKWVEQKYIKGGREGNLAKVLQNCLYKLKDEEEFFDDERFIDVWIKYANITRKAHEVYSDMYKRNIGLKSARFYIAWSWALEQMGNIKRAYDLLEEALQRGAQPIAGVKKASRDLQERVTSTVATTIAQNPEVGEQRVAFANLNPTENNRAPVSRIATSPASRENLVVGHAQPQPKSNIPSSKLPFQIYNSTNENAPQHAEVKGTLPVLNAQDSKENEKKPSKWNSAKRLQAPASKPKNLEFIIHKDRTPEPKSSRAMESHRELAMRKGKQNQAILFEESNPKQVRMYDFYKIYCGLEEVTFEEIRADKYWKKKKEESALLKLKEQIAFLEARVKDLECQSKSQEKSPEIQTIPGEDDVDDCQIPIKDVEDTQPVSSTTNLVQNIVRQLYNDTFACGSKDSTREECADAILEQPLANEQVDMGILEIAPPIKPKSAFTIFRDVTGTIPKSPLRKLQLHSQPEDHKENVIAPADNLDPSPELEDLENIPPADYVQPTANRTLAGILQPSLDVFYVPLEDQLTQEDEEENEEGVDDAYLAPSIPPDDMTMIPPLDTEHFAIMAHVSSTPFAKPKVPEDPKPIEQNLVSLDENEKHVCEALNQILSINTCPKVDDITKQTLQLVVEGKCSTHTKLIVDNLQLFLHINKNIKLESLVLRATALVDEIRKSKISSDATNHQLTQMTCQSWRLNTIMESSREGSGKSSSSCSSSNSTKFKGINTPCSVMMPNLSVKMSPLPPTAGTDDIITHDEDISIKEKFTTYLADLNPFDQAITDELLQVLDPPITSLHNFYTTKKQLLFKPGTLVDLGNVSCMVEKEMAHGAYAKIFVGIPQTDDTTLNGNLTCDHLALKVCRNANAWEFYVCSELHKRLSDEKAPKKPDISESIMKVMSCLSFKNNFVLVSQVCPYGTLLDVVNSYKIKGAPIPECITMFLTVELLTIMSQVHRCEILHGDVKPDNVLIRNLPTMDDFNNMQEKTNCLQLIDFGRGIDLSFFTPGIMFNVVVKTDSFQCPEMKEGQPWVHQTDWYGILSCIHILLFSGYMEVEKNSEGFWQPKTKFRRYWQYALWQSLFKDFLNMSVYQVPDVQAHIDAFVNRLKSPTMSQDFSLKIKEFAAIVKAKI